MYLAMNPQEQLSKASVSWQFKICCASQPHSHTLQLSLFSTRAYETGFPNSSRAFRISGQRIPPCIRNSKMPPMVGVWIFSGTTHFGKCSNQLLALNLTLSHAYIFGKFMIIFRKVMNFPGFPKTLKTIQNSSKIFRKFTGVRKSLENFENSSKLFFRSFAFLKILENLQKTLKIVPNCFSGVLIF